MRLWKACINTWSNGKLASYREVVFCQNWYIGFFSFNAEICIFNAQNGILWSTSILILPWNWNHWPERQSHDDFIFIPTLCGKAVLCRDCIWDIWTQACQNLYKDLFHWYLRQSLLCIFLSWCVTNLDSALIIKNYCML